MIFSYYDAVLLIKWLGNCINAIYPVINVARCFQLDIQKKIFRIFEKTLKTKRERWHIYFTEYFFTETRHLPKKFMVKKKLLKNLLFSNCDLWSPPKQHTWKQENLSNLSHNEKNFFDASENTFLRKVATYL